mmetsp:Transcript_48003/g.153174  ORF Transcript_48003/g.153174 Transcript_48003/m.153174 type:complete len:125 (+) Transcript_48003:88-462(+)
MGYENGPQPVTMGNSTGGASRQGGALGTRPEDYKGCWKQCGGCCLGYFMPCGDTCICAIIAWTPLICFPACDCYCQKPENPKEWKEPCDGDGNSNVIFMVDERTIKSRNEGVCGTCECCEWKKL